MTMPKGWKPSSRKKRSSNSYENQFSEHPEQKPKYRNPIPPGYMPSSPPPSRVTWPSRSNPSREQREGSGRFVIATVVIAIIVILLVASVTSSYVLILIPMIIIGAVRGLKRGSGMDRYHANMSRRGHRSR